MSSIEGEEGLGTRLGQYIHMLYGKGSPLREDGIICRHGQIAQTRSHCDHSKGSPVIGQVVIFRTLG